jgi:hypothetical protein
MQYSTINQKGIVTQRLCEQHQAHLVPGIEKQENNELTIE